MDLFSHFHILKLQFFQYFVGTSDTLSVQMKCLSALPTNFRMYRQNTEKALWGGGGKGARATLCFNNMNSIITTKGHEVQLVECDIHVSVQILGVNIIY